MSQTVAQHTQPVVSVCIAHFNDCALIAACIDSVLRQTAIDLCEIIVHDDCSSDESVAFIKRHYPMVTLIESKTNVGFCTANNRMVQCAQGDYILLLNNDAQLFPDAVSVLLRAAQAQPAIYGLPQYDTSTRALIDCGAWLDPFLNAVAQSERDVCEVAMVAGACFFLSKKIWNEIGGFPEWFESIAEDLYVCCYARWLGYPVMCINTSGYYHRVGSSLGGGKVLATQGLVTTYRRRALSERNRLFVLFMMMPLWWLLFILPLQCLMLLIEGMVIATLKRDKRLWDEIYAPLLPALFSYYEKWNSVREKIDNQKKISFLCWVKVIRWRPHKLAMLLRYGLPEVK